MDIEVDQSIKIKDAQDTVLAFSNEESRAIILPAQVKRAAEHTLRKRYRKPRNPELKIFAAGLFILLEPYLTDELQVTIDQEWPGEANEASVRAMLLNIVRQRLPGFRAEQIRFARIGRGSGAHKRAYAVHRGEEQADYIVTEEDLLRLL